MNSKFKSLRRNSCSTQRLKGPSNLWWSAMKKPGLILRIKRKRIEKAQHRCRSWKLLTPHSSKLRVGSWMSTVRNSFSKSSHSRGLADLVQNQ
jgi:hypothetical protein